MAWLLAADDFSDKQGHMSSACKPMKAARIAGRLALKDVNGPAQLFAYERLQNHGEAEEPDLFT